MNAWPLTTARVLVAEDDLDLLGLIGLSLHSAGFDVVKVSNGAAAIDAIEHEQFSLLVLDINIPLVNGLQVCMRLRKSSSAPVLMLSARDQERDLLDALAVGADAYMVKPFSPRAFIARVRALLRRTSINDNGVVIVNNAKLNIEEHLLLLGADQIRLTKLETRLLQLLMLNAGATVSTKTLIESVWDTYSTGNRNMLKQVIFRLRRKLVNDPVVSDLLRTMPDGYMWHVADASTVQPAPQPLTASR